jgi:phage gpG-like protein
MAGASIDMQLVADEASAVLAQLVEWAEAGDVGVWDDVGALIVSATEARFETSVGPDGVKWKPSQRAKKGRGLTLVDSGALKSLTHVARPDGVEVGSSVPYASVHQFGAKYARAARAGTVYFRPDRDGNKGLFTKRRRATFAQDVQIGAHTVIIPSRPFLGVNDDDEAAVLALLTARLQRLAGGGR